MPPTRPSVEAAWRSFFEDHHAEAVEAFVRRYPEERSLYVDVFDLHRFDPGFVESLFAEPADVLRRGADALAGGHDRLGRVNLRLRNLPSQLGLGHVRARHVSKLVSVEGVVDGAGPVEARAAEAAFVCDACGGVRRDRPNGIELPAPSRCPDCESTGTLELDRGRSTFVDLQRVDLGEAGDGDDAAGRTMAVYLDDDLVGTVAVGERLRVTGIVGLESRSDGNRFSFYLDGVAVDEQRPGRPDDDVDAPRQLKESIRERWESVVDG